MRGGECMRWQMHADVCTRESEMALVLSSFFVFGRTPANAHRQPPPTALVALQFQTSGQEVFRRPVNHSALVSSS